MRITYTGPSTGIPLLEHFLRDEGLTAQFEPFTEPRGAGDVIVDLIGWIGDSSGNGVVGGAAYAAACRAKDKFVAQFGRAKKVEIDPDGGHADEGTAEPHGR